MSLLTKAEAADRLGVPVRTIDTLRKQGRLSFIRIAGGFRYPPAAIEAFIANETEREPCREEIRGRDCGGLTAADAGTSSGPKTVAAASAAQALAIAERLKRSSPRSSTKGGDRSPAPVVPMKR